MHNLYSMSKLEKVEITPIVKEIMWRSNVDELGQQLNFSILNNDTKYFPKNPVDIGNLIILDNNKEILRTIVVSENKIGIDNVEYISFDYAFYLNKSSETYQFNNINCSKAIEKILNDFNIPIGYIDNIPINISKIYNGEIISNILKDILQKVKKETGIKYLIEMRKGKFYLEKETEKIIKASFKLADNIREDNIFSVISNQTIKRSIENMKNSIKVVSSTENKVHCIAKDQKHINDYGLLQKVHIIDNFDKSKAINIANNMLKDLNKILNCYSIEVPGNDEVRAGRIVEMKEELTGINKKYKIKSCIHNLKEGIHSMKIDMEMI